MQFMYKFLQDHYTYWIMFTKPTYNKMNAFYRTEKKPLPADSCERNWSFGFEVSPWPAQILPI